MTFGMFLLPFLWVLNGFLAVLYLLADHALVVLLLPLLGWLALTTLKAQQPWTLAAGGLALAAAVFAPSVVAMFLLLMAGGSVALVRVEKFNPLALRWRITGGLALYALIGLGAALYETLAPLLTDPTLAQGQNYLNVLVSLALWLYPLGFLGMLAQALWVHPPLEGGTPEDILVRTRTRGRLER